MAIDIGRGILRISPDVSGFQTDLRRAIPTITQGLGTAAIGAALTTGITLPLVRLGKEAVTTAISFEDSLAGVAKTLSGVESITDPVITNIGEQLRSIARETPVAVEELARIGEIAGQLGVPAENIADFAKTVAQLAATTDLTTESAAFSLAQFATVIGEDTDQISRYADIIVELGNNFATTEPLIVSMVSRIAGAGSTVGLASDEMLALATALSQVGVRAELGGTAISRVIVEIASTVAQGGPKLEAFAKTAGLTVEEFSNLQNTDPARALLAFIKGLQGVQDQGAEVFQVLEDLEFGNVRVRDVLLRSAGAAQEYEKALKLAKVQSEEGGAAAEEFGKRMETARSKIVVAQNNIRDAFIELGDDALPIVKSLAEDTASFAQFLTTLPSPIKGVIGTIVTLAGVVGPLLGTYGGFIASAGVIKLLRDRHKEAAEAALTQAGATDALALSLQRAQTASFAQGLSPARTATTIAGPGVTAIAAETALATAALRQTASRSALGRIGQSISRRFTGNLRPTMAGIGKGLGVALGASILSGVVETVETEADTGGRQVQNALAAGLTGAGIGATIGSIIPVIGTGIGAAVGGVGGLIVGALKDTSTDIEDTAADVVKNAVEGAGEEAKPTAVETGVLIAQTIAQGISASESLDPAFADFQNQMLEKIGEFSATVTQYATGQPSIFESLFDQESLDALLDGVPAQFSAAGKKVADAIPALNFKEIQDGVTRELGFLDELDETIGFLVENGLSGLAQQIAEKGGPEAIAAGRVLREQLINDPESVFNLEADILRLKGGIADEFSDLLGLVNTDDLAGKSEQVRNAITSGLLDASDTQGLLGNIEKGGIINDFFDKVVGNDTDLAERFATTLTGPLGEGARAALQRAFTEETFSADLNTLVPAIESAINEIDFIDVIEQTLQASFDQGQVVSVKMGENQIIDITNIDQFRNILKAEFTKRFSEGEASTPFEVATDILKPSFNFTNLEQNISQQIGTWLASPEFNAALAPSVGEEGLTTLQLQQKVLELISGQLTSITSSAIADSVGAIDVDLSEVDFNITGLETGVGEKLTDGLVIPQGTYDSVSGQYSQLVKTIISGMETEAEIQSPSRKTMRIAQQMIAGLNLGLDQDIGAALIARLETFALRMEAQGQRLAEAFIRGVENNLRDISLPTINAPGSGPIPQVAATSNPSSTTKITVINPTTSNLERDLNKARAISDTSRASRAV